MSQYNLITRCAEAKFLFLLSVLPNYKHYKNFYVFLEALGIDLSAY